MAAVSRLWPSECALRASRTPAPIGSLPIGEDLRLYAEKAGGAVAWKQGRTASTRRPRGAYCLKKSWLTDGAPPSDSFPEIWLREISRPE